MKSYIIEKKKDDDYIKEQDPNYEKDAKIKALLDFCIEHFQLKPIKSQQTIVEAKNQFRELDIYKAYSKIILSFIIKLAENQDNFNDKYDKVSIIFEKFYISADEFAKSTETENDPLFSKIKEITELLNVHECYSCFLYKYLIIFGNDKKNFMDIFQIIINGYMGEEIECKFDYSFDEIKNFVSNLLKKIMNENLKRLESQKEDGEIINQLNNKETLEGNNIRNKDKGNAQKNNLQLEFLESKEKEVEEGKKKEKVKKEEEREEKEEEKVKEKENEKKNEEEMEKEKEKEDEEKQKEKEEKNEKKEIGKKEDKEEVEEIEEEEEILKQEEENREKLKKNEDYNIETIIDMEMIKNLKTNLSPKENLKVYFLRKLKQYNLYSMKNYEKKYYLYDLANNNFYDITSKFFFSINYEKFPIISNMFSFLKNQLSPINDTNNQQKYKEYLGPNSFGYMLMENKEYFYLFKNKYNIDEIYNINNIKKYYYKNFELVDCSCFSNHTEKDNGKFDSHFIISDDFESKINQFFIANKELKELPCYFFRIKNKNKIGYKPKYRNYIDFDYAKKNYFLSFCEVEGAFIYDGITPLEIINKENSCFSTNGVVEFESQNAEVKEEKGFTIKGKSIILIESKLTIPKNIKKFNMLKKYKREELYSSLIFTIYKMIKKIKFYESYLNNNSENKYHYYLILFYNSNQIDDINDYVKKCLNLLKRKECIEKDDSSYSIKVVFTVSQILGRQREISNQLEIEVNLLRDKIKENEAENLNLREQIINITNNYEELKKRFDKFEGILNGKKKK